MIAGRLRAVPFAPGAGVMAGALVILAGFATRPAREVGMAVPRFRGAWVVPQRLAGVPTMIQTIGFGELLDTYWIEDRTLFALFEADEFITLRFDLYHCDDPERCRDGMKYRLDISIPRGHIQILDGSVERLRTEFCADILTAEIQQGDLHLLADCTFYPSRTNDIVRIVLSSGVARIEQRAPMPVTLPTAT